MRLFRQKNLSVGLPPGTLMPVTGEFEQQVRIMRFAYSPDEVEERQCAVSEIAVTADAKQTTWLNIDGLSDVSVIEKIGQEFGVHELALEDILTLDQRPKMEDHDEYLFAVLKMAYIEKNGKDEQEEIVLEQVSLILLDHTVLSFQERSGDVFDRVRERIRRGKGRVRRMDAGYLLYSLIDAVVDNYFTMMEHLGEKVEGLEAEVLDCPTPQTSARIHRMRRELLLLRRALWPLRELLASIMRSESKLLCDAVDVYYRDLYDHTVQVIETLETFREMVSGLLDLYLSSVSNRMNEIMKVLTIISTVFIPLSFIAGIYGMNFEYMPELHVRWAYPTLLGVMGLSIAASLLFFRRRKWL